MLRHRWRSIVAVAACVLSAPPAEAQDVGDARAGPTDPLPVDGLTRERLVDLYQALMPADFQPPACVAGQEMFTDVPAASPFCAWIEELARSGITGGCSPTQYCPGNAVTRAQMAVFVVKAMEACPTLDPNDEMIRVGGVCIDKYEASVWDAPVGGAQITGPIPCNPNGQDCSNIFARSVADVQPRTDITWFQAQRALANSGKRLPTNAEWQMAVRGTPDPGDNPSSENCNTHSEFLEEAGDREICVSAWGAFDMVGNLWEWVADWVPSPSHCPGWGSFSDDLMCLSGASTASQGPSALLRGGSAKSATFAGAFAVSPLRPSVANHEDEDLFVGFRGAR